MWSSNQALPLFIVPARKSIKGDFVSVKRYHNPTTKETIKIDQVVQKRSRDSFVEIDYDGGKRIAVVKSLTKTHSRAQLGTEMENPAEYNLRKIRISVISLQSL